MRTSVLFVTTALASFVCASNISFPAFAASDDSSAIIELPSADDSSSVQVPQHEAPLPTVVSYHDVTEGMLPKVSGVIQEKVSSGYVYQPTDTVVSRSATSELNASVTVGKVSSELYLIDTKGYNEQEVNFYYADSFKKTPFGKVDFSLMTGAWREPDGWIVPVTGEVSHDIVLHKSTTTNGITLTPFTGFSQWFGFGKEMNLAYVQSGLRSLLQLTPRISFSTEAAYSQCVHEAGTVSLRASTQALPSFSECHSVPYGNLSLICDIGNRFKLILGGQFTKDAPATAGLALVKRF